MIERIKNNINNSDNVSGNNVSGYNNGLRDFRNNNNNNVVEEFDFSDIEDDGSSKGTDDLEITKENFLDAVADNFDKNRAISSDANQRIYDGIKKRISQLVNDNGGDI